MILRDREKGKKTMTTESTRECHFFSGGKRQKKEKNLDQPVKCRMSRPSIWESYTLLKYKISLQHYKLIFFNVLHSYKLFYMYIVVTHLHQRLHTIERLFKYRQLITDYIYVTRWKQLQQLITKMINYLFQRAA